MAIALSTQSVMYMKNSSRH